MRLNFELNMDNLEERALLAKIAEYLLPKPKTVTAVTLEGQTKPVVEAVVPPITSSPVGQATTLPPQVKGSPCPKCKTGIVVSKVAKASGKAFLACSTWPACKWTQNV